MNVPNEHGGLSKSPISRSRYIPENEHRIMSRMGPPELNPIARFYPSEKTVAVVYSSAQPFGGGLNVQYNLVVYDLKGRVLPDQKKEKHQMSLSSSFQLANSSMEKTTTCSIDAKGNIWQNAYENKWKNDVRKNGTNSNKLVDFKLQKTQVFNIAANGSIAALKEYPTTFRASLD